MDTVKQKRSKKLKVWRLEESRAVYTFDTVEESSILLTVTVVDGKVWGYSGVYALDSEIIGWLESRGIEVPRTCRA